MKIATTTGIQLASFSAGVNIYTVLPQWSQARSFLGLASGAYNIIGGATYSSAQWRKGQFQYWPVDANAMGAIDNSTVSNAMTWMEAGQSLKVQPRWLGRQQPVTVNVEIQSATVGDRTGSELP